MREKIIAFYQHELPYYKKRFSKKYYIIRRSYLGAGFFSNYCWVMGHVVFARKLGYIPVVDMLNYKTLYSEEEPVEGEENAWNYYFENVGVTDLETAYASKKYVLAEDRSLEKYASKYCEGVYRYPGAKAIDYYYPVTEKFMRIRQDIRKEFEEDWNHMVSPADCVLGIHVRGTDMRNNLGHPVPAAVEKYIEKAKEMLEETKRISKIFLATDEENVIAAFREAFENTAVTVMINDAFRVTVDPKASINRGVHETAVEHPRTQHKYRMGLEVLKDAWFLTHSDYLICGHSNITNIVLIWNNHAFKKVVCLEST